MTQHDRIVEACRAARAALATADEAWTRAAEIARRLGRPSEQVAAAQLLFAGPRSAHGG